MIVDECDKISISTNEIYLHQSINIRMHRLKVILGFTTCILAEFTLMLLLLHSFFTNFSRYVDQWQPRYHFVLLQVFEILKIEISKTIVPYPLFSTHCCSKTSMLHNLQFNLEGSIHRYMSFKDQNPVSIYKAQPLCFPCESCNASQAIGQYIEG